MSKTSARTGSSKSKQRVKATKPTCHCCRRAPSSGLFCFCSNQNLRECQNCGEEVCQPCRRKGMCYPCRIKKNPITGSKAALQDLSEEQLQGILQMLHFDKMAYQKWDKEQMVTQITKRCNIQDNENDYSNGKKDPPPRKDLPPALIELKPQPIKDMFPSPPAVTPPQPPKVPDATVFGFSSPQKTSSPKQMLATDQQTSQPPLTSAPVLPLKSEILVGNEKNLYDTPPVRAIALDEIQNNEDIEKFSVRELQCLLQAYGKPDADSDDLQTLIDEVRRLWQSEIETGAALTISAISDETAVAADVFGRSHSESGSESRHSKRSSNQLQDSHAFERSSEGRSGRESHVDPSIKATDITIRRDHSYSESDSESGHSKRSSNQLQDSHAFQRSSQGQSGRESHVDPFTKATDITIRRDHSHLESDSESGHSKRSSNQLQDSHAFQQSSQGHSGRESHVDPFTKEKDITIRRDHSHSESDSESRHSKRSSKRSQNSHTSEKVLEDKFIKEIQERLSEATDPFTEKVVPVRDDHEYLEHRKQLHKDSTDGGDIQTLKIKAKRSSEASGDNFEIHEASFVQLASIPAEDIENRKQQRLANKGTADTPRPRGENVVAISESRNETHQSYEILTMIADFPPPPPIAQTPLDTLTLSDIKQMSAQQHRDILRDRGVLVTEEPEEMEQKGRAYLMKQVVNVWQLEKFPSAVVDDGGPPAVAGRQVSVTSNVSEVDSELEKMLSLPSDGLAIDDAFQTLQKLEDNAEAFHMDIEVGEVTVRSKADQLERSFSALYERSQSENWGQRGSEGLDIETEFQMSLKPLPAAEVISATLKQDPTSPTNASEQVHDWIADQARKQVVEEEEELARVEIRSPGEPTPKYRSSWIVYLESIPESHVDTMEEFKLRAILRAFNDNRKDLWKREDLIREVKARWRELHQAASLPRKSGGVDGLKDAGANVRRQPSSTSLSSLQDVSLENVANEYEIRALPTRTLQSILQAYGVPMTGLIIRPHYIREVIKLWEKVKALQARDLHIEITKDGPEPIAKVAMGWKTPPLLREHRQEEGSSRAAPNGLWVTPVLAKEKDDGNKINAQRTTSNAHPRLLPGNPTDDDEDLSRVRSLSDISMTMKIDRLTIDQIRSILRKHSVPHDDNIDKSELLFRLERLLHDRKNHTGGNQ